MFQVVREDRSRPWEPVAIVPSAPGNGEATCGRLGVGYVLFGALAVVAMLGGNAVAQNQPTPTVFKATVADVSAQLQRITVPLYGNVVIDTNIEVQRADVTASQVADVQVVSPKRLLVMGRSYGQTTLVLQTADGQQQILEVIVELNLSRLNDSLKGIDPLSDAQASSVLGNIVLTGTVSSADAATRIVELASLFLPPNSSGGDGAVVQNHLDVAGEQQVLLRCVVAEVSRSASRQLGVNAFLAGDTFRDAFFVSQIGGINPINIGAAADQFVNTDLGFVTGGEGIPLRPTTTLSLGFPRVQLQTFIKAMADNTLLKILAEPNLVAISGETASFLAGGEFPIPVPQGLNTISIQFRKFGVRLNFTPIVRGQQRIRLRVAPEVSDVDFTTAVQIQGLLVPGLTTRSTETTVELGSGETIAIAGLLSEQTRAFATRVPGLGDMPILGALFRSVEYRHSLTELVIFVTPEIVAPLDAHQPVALPTDRTSTPSDLEFYGYGMIEAAAKTVVDNDGLETHPASGIGSQPDVLSVHGPWGHEGRVSSR